MIFNILVHRFSASLAFKIQSISSMARNTCNDLNRNHCARRNRETIIGARLQTTAISNGRVFSSWRAGKRAALALFMADLPTCLYR